MKLKAVFIVILLPLFSFLHAQHHPSFRIITFAGDVTLDKAPVVFNQQVTNASKKLKIKKGGYVGILTSQGVLEKLDEGNYEVAELINSRWFPSWTPHPPLISPRVTANRLLGDSIVLRWTRSAGENTSISITNMWDEKVLDTVVNSNELIMNVRKLLNRETAISFRLKLRPDPYDQTRFVGRITPEQLKQLNYDLVRIDNSPYKEILTIVILQLNELHYDVALRIIKQTSTPKDLPDDLKKYIDHMRDELQPK